MTAAELEKQYKKLGFWAIVVVVLVLVAVVLAPFANALMWAVVLSVLTYPLYRRLCKRFNETISSLLTIFSALFLVAIPLGLVGLMVFLQFRGVVDDFEAEPPRIEAAIPPSDGVSLKPEEVPPVEPAPAQASTPAAASVPPAVMNLANRADASLKTTYEQFKIDFRVASFVRDNYGELLNRITGPITRGAAAAVVNIVLMVVAFLTMFFMLRDGHKLLTPTKELLPLPPAWTQRILERVQRTIHAVFMGVVLVAFIQGVLATIAYSIVGIDGWLLWGAATMVLCAIPLLGSPIIYVPLGLMLLGQGKLWQGIFLLAFGFIVISNIDNLLRPKYIGDRVGLHYISIFFSLLGGILAFGPVGLMAGPVLLTVLLELIEYARRMRSEGQDDLGYVEPNDTDNAAQVAPSS